MAIRFEKAFGIKADTMLRMQAAYDLAQARLREREIVVDRVAA
jgi:antitoxin HigA-1